jgi:hypothetical protein
MRDFKIDLILLENVLRNMKRHMPEWKVVKRVGMENGWWKNKPRGNPKLGFKTGFGKDKKGE